MRTLGENVLDLLVSDTKSELLGLGLDDAVAHIVVPHELAQLVFLNVLSELLEHVLVLFDATLIVLDGQFAAHHLTYLLASLIARGLARSCKVSRNEAEQSQTDDTHQPRSPASDFSNCCHLSV